MGAPKSKGGGGASTGQSGGEAEPGFPSPPSSRAGGAQWKIGSRDGWPGGERRGGGDGGGGGKGSGLCAAPLARNGPRGMGRARRPHSATRRPGRGHSAVPEEAASGQKLPHLCPPGPCRVSGLVLVPI